MINSFVKPQDRYLFAVASPIEEWAIGFYIQGEIYYEEVFVRIQNFVLAYGPSEALPKIQGSGEDAPSQLYWKGMGIGEVWVWENRINAHPSC